MNMTYANGGDPKRKVHPAGTQPQPPQAFRKNDEESDSRKSPRNRLPLHISSEIDYTDFAKSASRRGVDQYFDLDEETKMPIPMDANGFFRVSPIKHSDDSVKVAYRVRATDIALWSRELAAFEVPRPSDRDLTRQDILSAALRLSEIRKEEIERGADLAKPLSSVHKLFGDYPLRSPKS